MTSLEFIEKEIKKRIDNISVWGKLLKDDPNDKFSARCLNKYKEELEVLFKIKSKLEAWEVVKPYVDIIDKYTPYPTWQLKPNYDECKLKETNILIKALEVEDES